MPRNKNRRSGTFLEGYDFSLYFHNPDCQPISREEEEKLVAEKVGGSAVAERRLVLANMLWVIQIAHQMTRTDKIFLIEDAVQAGAMGLMEAIKSFDPAFGVRITTYAFHSIRQHILVERNASTIIRVPIGHSNPRSKNQIDWIREAGVVASKSRRISDIATGHDDYNEDEFFSLQRSHIGRTCPDTDESADTPDVGWLMRSLSERQRNVIRKRYGIGCEKQKLHAIGKEMGRCRERVRQIEVEAISRLRKLAWAA